MVDLYVALAAAAIVALLTVAEITERWRTWLWNNQHSIGRIFDCPFCVSWYVCFILAILTEEISWWQLIRIPALVTGCAIGVLLINLMMASIYGRDEETKDT